MVRSKVVKILMTKTRPLVGPQEVLYNNADIWKVEKQNLHLISVQQFWSRSGDEVCDLSESYFFPTDIA